MQEETGERRPGNSVLPGQMAVGKLENTRPGALADVARAPGSRVLPAIEPREAECRQTLLTSANRASNLLVVLLHFLSAHLPVYAAVLYSAPWLGLADVAETWTDSALPPALSP